ncbi:hypothetical protein [uncultured Helicobacter sp.]|uniref:hypothetical protein n=2 Tax=uncultured Helicobacter sp. TaxID=175537 RepID=UPI0025DBF884|nr:hypothetical protein [uncultured Helicobacter sp.]
MKITNATQQINKEDLKKQATQETKQTQNINKNSSDTKATQGVDTNDIKNNLYAQKIKDTNNDIGKLQVAQKSLNSIESDAEKITKLSQEYKETFDKTDQDDIKQEMVTLQKNIESTLKNATFEGSNVFAKNIKDSEGRVIFNVAKINMRLLKADAQKFYDTLKEQQKQIKDAIQTLQKQAEGNTEKIAGSNAAKHAQGTNSSFLKRLGSLFSVSHNADKLDKQRVQELLS